MTKIVTLASLISVSLLGLTSVPAQAHISASDCAYARWQPADTGTEKGNYSYNKVLLERCMTAQY